MFRTAHYSTVFVQCAVSSILLTSIEMIAGSIQCIGPYDFCNAENEYRIYNYNGIYCIMQNVTAKFELINQKLDCTLNQITIWTKICEY